MKPQEALDTRAKSRFPSHQSWSRCRRCRLCLRRINGGAGAAWRAGGCSPIGRRGYRPSRFRRPAVGDDFIVQHEPCDILAGLVARAIDMAKEAPEDQYAGLAPHDRLLTGELPELDADDGKTPIPHELRAAALECEDAARAGSGVTNSEGAGASASARSLRWPPAMALQA